VSSALLAGARRCGCAAPHARPALVAVTGGPGAGKTAILEMARKELCPHVVVLPEAAGIVFGGGFPRLPHDAARRAAQRAIFHVQRQSERLAQELGGVALVLCDRGTLDGVAYWPDEVAGWCEDLGVALEAERARYAAVLHLDTPDARQGYNHENALRTETAEEASRIDERIRAAWAGHPRVHHVDSRDDFLAKAREALDLLRALVPVCCRG
jgi:predicted ATPase